MQAPASRIQIEEKNFFLIANKNCKTKEQMYVKIVQIRPAHIKRNKQRELAKGKMEKENEAREKHKQRK